MDGGRPVFPRRLYTRGLEPYPVKSINYYSSNPLLFRALSEVLLEDEWLEVAESPLGVLLKFKDLNFGWASRCVHYMLSFQLECKKKYEIWSLVGVNPVRFSLNEFEHITGLNCDYDEDMDPEVPLTEEHIEFWGRLGVPPESGPSIDQLTAACDAADEWPREDRIRLGYMALYAGFVEARSPGSPTRVNLARMVMDLPQYAKFPWGRLAFMNLMDSVKSVDLTKSYTIEGFVQVLQCWVYYAMPDFGTSHGKPIPHVRGQERVPLLSYQGSKGLKYFKPLLLKQRRFNHLVYREREDMVPLWDEEFDGEDEDDDCVDALIGAFMNDYTQGPWKWSKDDFADEGFLISNVTKDDLPKPAVSKQAVAKQTVAKQVSKGKKRAREESDSEDEGQMDAIVKNKVEELVGGISVDVRAGFHAVTENFEEVFTHMIAMSEQMNILTAQVGGLQQQVRKLRKRARTTTSGAIPANLEAGDNVHADAGLEGDAEDDIPLAEGDQLNEETTPKKIPHQPTPTDTPAKTPTKIPPKTPTKNQTPTKSPARERAEEEVMGDEAEDKAAEKARGKAKEGDPGARTQGSSESVARKPDPSLEIIEGPSRTKQERYEEGMKKQEPKRTAALKLIRANRDRVRFASQPGLGTSSAVPQTIVISDTSSPSQSGRGRGYNPFAPVDKLKVKALQEFIKTEKTYPRRPKGSVGAWFFAIKGCKQWLHDSHMDAAMCMLRRRLSSQPELFRTSRICFAETDLQRYWRRDYDQFKSSPANMDGSGKLFPSNAWSYFTGELPSFWRTNQMWMEDVDDVYLPMHIGGDHWVAAWISLTQRHITIWDSIPSHTSERQIAELVQPIAEILPFLIYDLALKPEHKGTPLEPFTHGRVTFGVPRNVVAGDCGVFAFKYIECHALGLPFPKELCDENMKDLRAKLAAEIWDETKKKGDEVAPVGADVYDQ